MLKIMNAIVALLLVFTATMLIGEELTATGIIDNNYLFTGEQYDKGLDQYYFRARNYDPSIGRSGNGGGSAIELFTEAEDGPSKWL